jgi:spore coat protein A
LYKIVDKDSIKEKKVYARYGVSEAETKYMIVTDKSFKTNGELYYPEETPNENFEAWVPEFFGNTMLVNGVLWPKMNLKQGKHRIVFLNGCQSRFLNIWFDNNGVKIPFELIRADGAFYSKPVTVTELLAAISTRYEIILDLSQVNGEVIMKNNANGPYPNGG